MWPRAIPRRRARARPGRASVSGQRNVNAGEAEVLVEGAWRPLRAGDVASFPGDAVHGARNRGASTCRIMWIFPTDTDEELEYVDD
jgi:uncharacterized cupin superfamily protein